MVQVRAMKPLVTQIGTDQFPVIPDIHMPAGKGGM
jgi:hypothetical protein